MAPLRLVVIVGGVVSGLGKGITASTIGKLIQMCGYSVTAVKIDPYLNVDAGTMNPYEHGECYVLSDGTECDLDLGNYERFLGLHLDKRNSITTGQIFLDVIQQERAGTKFLGQTVQYVPHITSEIKRRITEAAKCADVAMVELGGTVGDIEAMVFLEALVSLQRDEDIEICFIQVSLAPFIENQNKTKPVQHSLKELRRYGITPNFLCVRSRNGLNESEITKIKNLCHLQSSECVIQNKDFDNIYYVLGYFHSQNVHTKVLNVLGLTLRQNVNVEELVRWQSWATHTASQQPSDSRRECHIAVVGKYVERRCRDTYLSIERALEHAGFVLDVRLVLYWVSSSSADGSSGSDSTCSNGSTCGCGISFNHPVDGILIPGGFGTRGTDGIVRFVQYARENRIPLLGICLGMQAMVIEAARNLAGLKHANSTEFMNSPTQVGSVPVVVSIESLDLGYGGTMRLGAHSTHLLVGNTEDKQGAQSCVREAYTAHAQKFGKGFSNNIIVERHRHRYEVNPVFKEILESAGLHVTGVGIDGSKFSKFIDVVEVTDHPFFVGVQFHPEFESSPYRGTALFNAFIQAAAGRSSKK